MSWAPDQKRKPWSENKRLSTFSSDCKDTQGGLVFEDKKDELEEVKWAVAWGARQLGIQSNGWNSEGKPEKLQVWPPNERISGKGFSDYWK